MSMATIDGSAVLSATSDSAVLGTYAYDGVGNLYAKTVGALTTSYILDLTSALPQVLCETTGATTMAYVYAGGDGSGPLETERAGVPYWYLADPLGSVRVVTDGSGVQAATYAYSPFGEVSSSSGGSLLNEILFAGQRTDSETGLQYLRARTYDPSTGTFLQRDTWAGNANISQSQNRYLYGQGDPINMVDPSGRCGLDFWNCGSEIAQTASQTAQDLGKNGEDLARGTTANLVAGSSWLKDRADSGIGSGNQFWQGTGGAAINWVHDHPVETAAIAMTTLIVVGTCISSCPVLLDAAVTLALGGPGLACMVGCVAAANMALPTIALGGALWNGSHPGQQVDLSWMPLSPGLSGPEDYGNVPTWTPWGLRGPNGRFANQNTWIAPNYHGPYKP